MGQAMAARLLGAGHELTVYNRSRAAAEALAGRGACIAGDPQGTLDSQVVISMLADDLASEQVWITSGLVQKMPASCVHLNMATNSLKMGKRLAGLHETAGANYV